MKTPFFIGESSDDVVKVARKTYRKRLAVEFTTEEGETFRFDLSAKTAKERRRKIKAMKVEVRDKRIKLSRLPRVRYFYADCALTFERNRGPSGEGALCYRVTEIEATQ